MNKSSSKPKDDDTTRARSAITGEFVKKSTAERHPETTVVESTANDGKNELGEKQPRSAITGEFVKRSTAERHPETTVGTTYDRSSKD